ncbi:hypothetical protein E6C27_scaffold243G004630 [Cucumis melo var. makuwa]|uniref:Uncharacterized protein n=1 Tax=Cucumis melo var. makuwa TaxID=1194695 RepID=A0A5A7TS90_CUCMM|nr:hypothetical protein E6C27_scaffold243G004630 [Cucumis melo var. makuwa]
MKSEVLRKLKDMDYQMTRRIGGDQKPFWKRYAERKTEMRESSPARDCGGWMNVGRRCSSEATATRVGGTVAERAETVRDVERDS